MIGTFAARRPQAADHLEPVEVRQAEVEQHDLGRFARQQVDRAPARRGLQDAVALGPEAGAQQAADRRLVVDHEQGDAARAHSDAFSCCGVTVASGKVMVNTAPEPSARLAASIVPPSASTKPRQIASPSPVPARCRSPLPAAVELVEHALHVSRREPRPLVGDPEHDPVMAPAARDRNGRARRRVLGGVVEQVDQHLLEQHHVEVEHGQVGLEVDRDAVLRQRRGRPLQGRADDLAEVDGLPVEHDPARFETGHVEQVGDEPAQALGLVLDRGRELVAGRRVVEGIVLAQRRHCASDGGERGLEVVRERRQQRGTQPLRLDRQARLVPLLPQADALVARRRPGRGALRGAAVPRG